MLLYFAITCFSFLLFSKSLPLKTLPPWASETRLISNLFLKELTLKPTIKSIVKTFSPLILPKALLKGTPTAPKFNQDAESASAVTKGAGMSFLDLPDLVLECILERLPPSGLCSMAGVCSSLRERCLSDHLWERHMRHKWGRVLGPAAYREWQWHIAAGHHPSGLKQGKHRGFIRILYLIRSLSWTLKSKADPGCENQQENSGSPSLRVDSVMNLYLTLETGRFWFPAQVYNRENGHVGFMLSCYDAELSYDPRTDTFQARYPPHGRRPVAIETGVPWERLRAPPIDSPPHNLHISDCLNELRPGNHIEIQWRRNKEFPYGWWYGVVGHLESCDAIESHCHCHQSDTVVLEFNQYAPGSRWRRTTVSRRDHREEGNEADGFYGGIRKLTNESEIATWKRLWPISVLD